MSVELWMDVHGTVWELVVLGDGDCLVRQGLDMCDVIDGDAREGVQVMARFSDPADARIFLWEEGFDPVRDED